MWHLRVGDVLSALQQVPDGPARVASIAVLPGMRKLFLARPDQPERSGPLTAAELRLTPHCTIGDDVVVALLERASDDEATPGTHQLRTQPLSA